MTPPRTSQRGHDDVEKTAHSPTYTPTDLQSSTGRISVAVMMPRKSGVWCVCSLGFSRTPQPPAPTTTTPIQAGIANLAGGMTTFVHAGIFFSLSKGGKKESFTSSSSSGGIALTSLPPSNFSHDQRRCKRAPVLETITAYPSKVPFQNVVNRTVKVKKPSPPKTPPSRPASPQTQNQHRYTSPLLPQLRP